MGVDGIMSDTASLHVLFDTMIDRSRFPNGKIIFRYTLVTEEAVVAGNQVMARWVMTTTNAVQLGANVEVSKQGMLCCKFNSAHKIIGLELMFDVMAFMLQLKQATGVEGFAVVPNTVQTCQRNFDKPMVVTLAEPPYTIIQVNKLWEDMTGFTASEVVGKVSCSILQFPGMDSTAVNAMMQEIRFKRPASAMLVNKTKSGALFSLFLVCYPLSMDSRITYYLGLTLYYAPGDFNEDRSQDQLAPQSSTSTLLQAGAFSGSQSTMMPPMMFPGMVSGGQMGVLPTASIRPPSNTASRIMDEIQRSGSIENVKNDGDANITR
jgi:PAS domain S-box-containing protein